MTRFTLALLVAGLTLPGAGVFFTGGDQARVMDVLADTELHFVKRQRQNRLFGLVLKHPEERGVGIDEETALVVTGGYHAEVVGKGLVMLVDAKGQDRLEITLLRPGQTIDLRERP